MNKQQIISMLQDYRSLVVEMITLKTEGMPVLPMPYLNNQRRQDELRVLRETHTQINTSIHQLKKNGQKTV